MKIVGYKKFSNSYILKRFDGVFLIDPSFNYEAISEKIKGFKLWGILLTHGHYHHFAEIGRFNCPVYIHKLDYFTFTDDNLNGFNENSYNKSFELNNINLKLIDEDVNIEFVDTFIEVIHTPGHSKGSVTYYYDNSLYTGDLINEKGLNKTKRKGYSLYQTKRSIKKLYDRFSPNIKVYPGHGNDTTLLKIRQQNEVIRNILK